MKTSDISNLSIQNAMRLTIKQAQIELVKAQTEATTGKYADIGASIGSRTSVSIDLNRTIQRLESLSKTNATATTRLESSQESMDLMKDSAQKVKNQLALLKNGTDETTMNATITVVKDALDAFTGAANFAVMGEYIFAGINSDVKPMSDYQDPASGLKGQVETALQTYMTANGITATKDMTAAQMGNFLDTVVEPMFTGADWSDWSSATDDPITTRISQTEVVQTSTSLNNDGMRKFVMSSVIVLELYKKDFSAAARSVLVDKAINSNNEAVTGIIDQQTQLGLSQERVKKANDSLAVQKDIIKNQLNDAVGVDAYEASTRVNNLLALTEASYTLTARIQQLSLVNFL